MRRYLFIIFSLLFSSSILAFSNDDEGESGLSQLSSPKESEAERAPAAAGSSRLDPIMDEEIQIVVESGLSGQSSSKGSPRDQLTMKFSSKEERACVQTNIGTFYCNALNNMKNFTEAMRWFKKAAAQKYAEAQFSIGMLYDYGLGVPPNHAKAMKWYLRAAAQKHAGAQYNIGMLYDNTEGSVQDFAEAMRWYLLAADQNHERAQYCIGMLYEMGLGVLPNRAEAIKWFQKAAAQGHELAKENLKRLKSKTKSVRFISGLGLRR